MKLTARLYDAFEDDAIGWEAAKAIGQIPSPDTVLTKANHAEVKVSHAEVGCLYIIALTF